MIQRRKSTGASSQPESFTFDQLDFADPPGWTATEPIAALEVSPRLKVDLQAALTEVAVQPEVPQSPLWMCHKKSFEAPAGRLVRLTPGMVESRMGIAVHPRAGFLAESIRKPLKMEKQGYVFHETGQITFPGRKVTAIDAPAVHLALPFDRNYFHWLFEGVARFLVAREFIPDDARIAVRSRRTPFETETLAAVGVDPDAVLELPSRRLVRFSELYVPPWTVTGDWGVLPSAVDALRSIFDVTHHQNGSRRLYITRRGTSRHVVNDAELRTMLARLGFVELAAAELTVREQAARFAEAEAVIGVHGAGLANAVFSAPGTLLVELQSPELYATPRAAGPFASSDPSHDLFWNLAAAAELRYLRVVCKPVTPGRRDSDIEVDCSHLDSVLRRWLPT